VFQLRGLHHCVLNEVLPDEYKTTAKIVANYIYGKTNKQVPEDVQQVTAS
jgi:6-pyruvoyltetrahydropterin/6-carboxytetrahydropterin synthase